MDFVATKQSRNAITGQLFVKGCHRLWSVTGTKSRIGNNSKRPGCAWAAPTEVDAKNDPTEVVLAALTSHPLLAPSLVVSLMI